MNKVSLLFTIMIVTQLYIVSSTAVAKDQDLDGFNNAQDVKQDQITKKPVPKEIQNPKTHTDKEKAELAEKANVHTEKENQPNANEHHIPVQVQFQYESDQKQIEKQERQYENQQLNQIQQKLHPWISQELESLEQRAEFYIGQQFNVPIDNGASYLVRWNPQKHTVSHMQIYVLMMDQNGDISAPQNPQEDQHILISVSADGRPVKNLGKVYINQVFALDFTRPDYYEIIFKNNYANTVILTIDLEGQRKILQNGVKDDQFMNSRNKMVEMLQDMEQTQIRRQNRYKWEWGFKDRQLRHQQQMLALTGVELFVIIVTAIVQMYCIKSLLDNRSIV